MPFSTDATWPEGLCRIFEICRRKHELDYNGPYNSLLNYCFDFGHNFQYTVTPENVPSDVSFGDTVDFIRFLVILDAKFHPVLVIDIKDDSWNTRANLRLRADQEMRRMYDAMLANCQIPHLWGLSLLGTSLRVYCGNVATGGIAPAFQSRPSHNHTLPPNFLEGAWNMDILSQQGFNQMKEIVGEILANNAAL